MVNACLMHCTGPNIERVHGIGVFSLIERAAGESDRERKERYNIVTTSSTKEKRNGNRGSPRECWHRNTSVYTGDYSTEYGEQRATRRTNEYPFSIMGRNTTSDQ